MASPTPTPASAEPLRAPGPRPAPVHLEPGRPRDAGAAGPEDELLASADSAAGDVDASLELARHLGTVLPGPGEGDTRRLWSTLATLGALDLTTARVVEPHLDALAILRQAGVEPSVDPAGSTWGVFAAEGPGVRVTATGSDDEGWRLDGVKPWCSLADRLSHAVVTAHTARGSRRAFAVELRHPGVSSAGGTWSARGLRDVPSLATRFDSVPATPVGADDWYLTRPGFAWGGIGVAACWFGGAVGLARTLLAAGRRRAPDQVALMHLGAVDTALHAARAALVEAAGSVDGGAATEAAGALLAARVRGVVVDAVEQVLTRAAHGLGPGPLTADEAHAARVADLQVYVRQHHAERDQAALGQLLLDDEEAGR